MYHKIGVIFCVWYGTTKSRTKCNMLEHSYQPCGEGGEVWVELGGETHLQQFKFLKL